ncbi:hypothetical protein T440DRAFT_491031 [Plenodomus tracheiphilus IPT5]|uniref:Rhodopsin domain-containing protein n=1 Tax=Plenodomus tracheiphilus IPT5 TaxID=1408161 RepID=A0A6A7B2F7_9PLEO|nr:hypothetical protein T440DRAFT_491031 [Plenodomus tracheiphilus IPT5]
MALLFCILRTVSKLTLPGAQLGLDDYTIYVAVLYYIDEPIHVKIVTLTKISILLPSLGMFPKQSFRRMVYVCMILNGLYLFAFIIVSVFQCRPIDHAWKNWHKETAGTCRNVNAQGWGAAIFNIILDLATIVLPLRQLSELMDVGVMCACMPALHSLFKRYWPKVFGATTWDKLAGGSGVSGASASHGGVDRVPETPKNTDRESFIPLVEVTGFSGSFVEHELDTIVLVIL